MTPLHISGLANPVTFSSAAVCGGTSRTEISTPYWTDGNGCVCCSHDHCNGTDCVYTLDFLFNSRYSNFKITFKYIIEKKVQNVLIIYLHCLAQLIHVYAIPSRINIQIFPTSVLWPSLFSWRSLRLGQVPFRGSSWLSSSVKAHDPLRSLWPVSPTGLLTS